MSIPFEAGSPFPAEIIANNPLFGNPLLSRDDVECACLSLTRPVSQHFSNNGTRVWLGAGGAGYPQTPAALEGFIRPYWGLLPLMHGGGSREAMAPLLQGIIHGVDPEDPGYWGHLKELDQRLVEYCAFGYALALMPDQIWGGLPEKSRQQLAEWLDLINTNTVVDNNWLFFRVLVNLGLKKVGWADRAEQTRLAFERLDEFYKGDGWYTDGPDHRTDYYIPFAIHFYGLIYAKLAADIDPERCAELKRRASKFAAQYQFWFDPNGASVPLGRSLYYRFAASSFWGAMAFADAELPSGMSWGQVKSLYLRNLRWWSDKPIADRDGILTIGYVYPNLLMSEVYNSPCGPYWATKAFIALSVPSEHPFWSSPEEAPAELTTPSIQPVPRAILYRGGDHTVALNGGQHGPSFRHGAAKYAKFAYSSRFGFSVPSEDRGLEGGCYDSALALSDDGIRYRVREGEEGFEIANGALHFHWRPWADVEIETWLVPAAPWHIRVHIMTTGRRLDAAEGGFAIDRTGDDSAWPSGHSDLGLGYASFTGPAGLSGIRDLGVLRVGKVVRANPNTNVMVPRTFIPTLTSVHEPGSRTILCSAVLADRSGPAVEQAWRTVPELPHWLAERAGLANLVRG